MTSRTIPDHTIDLTSQQTPQQQRYLLSDGRVVDVISYSLVSGNRAVLNWATEGMMKAEIEKFRVEGTVVIRAVI
jgi:hypothetical protein